MQFTDNRQSIDFEQGYMDQRPSETQIDIVPFRLNGHKAHIKSKYAKKLDKIRLEKRKRGQVIQLFIAEGKTAEMLELGKNIRDEFSQVEAISITAGEFPFDIDGAKLRRVIKGLEHGDLIQVGVHQTGYQPAID